MENLANYKPDVLVRMAQDYLEAKRDYEAYVAAHKKEYGFLVLKTEDDKLWYWVKGKESDCKWGALIDACELVGADVNTVVATTKAMNRYEKKMDWKVCAHLPNGWCPGCRGAYGDTRVRRFFAAVDESEKFFRDTYRQRPWGQGKVIELFWYQEHLKKRASQHKVQTAV